MLGTWRKTGNKANVLSCRPRAERYKYISRPNKTCSTIGGHTGMTVHIGGAPHLDCDIRGPGNLTLS